MGTWNNDDGLYVKYGTDEGVSTHPAGEYKTYGMERCTSIVVDLSELTTTNTILNDSVWIPANAFITRVEYIMLETGAAGTSIDIGLIAKDRSTAVDIDGLLNTVELLSYTTLGETRSLTVNEESTALDGSGAVGALVGTEITVNGYFCGLEAGDHTTGELKLNTFWIPRGVDNIV